MCSGSRQAGWSNRIKRAKPKTGRKKDLILETRKENTGDLSQSKTGEVLS